MASDELHQDRRRKRGREDLGDTVQDQIRAKEQEISALNEEIRILRGDIKEKEGEIKKKEEELKETEKNAIASGPELRETFGQKLQFLRQEINSLRQATLNRDQQIISLQQAINSVWSVQALAGLEGGMQIGLESGEPVESYHPLSQFVACLQDSTLQKSINDAKPDSVIELPKGVVWLGDEDNFTNQLFMRPCYFELLEAKEEYFKLNSTLRAVVYTGTPGIGKSHMCAFVVARKLIAGTVVFFERAVKSDKDVEERVVYRLELAKCVHSFKSPNVLDSVSRNENAVYIVDGLCAGFPQARVQIQIFASPSEALYRPQRKVWLRYLYLYTPLFDLEELRRMQKAVSAFHRVSTEDLNEWFLAAGGVARTVLKRASLRHSVQDWKAEAQKLIFNMEKEDIEKVVIGIQGGDFSCGSDTLFHWRVDEKYVGERGDSPEKVSMRRFKRKVLCLASAWVATELHLRFRFEKLVAIASLILTTSKDVELAALRGYWFETLGHMMLSGGGEFNCRWLVNNDKFTLTLPQSVSYFFKSDDDASMSCRDDLSTYCVPVGGSQAAIDSLSSPFLFFQMASGPDHSISKGGMVNIVDAMNKRQRCTSEADSKVRGACDPRRPPFSGPVLVFCTTPSNFDRHYKTPQKFVQGKKKASEVENIQQAVLELPINLGDVKKLASQ